MRFRLLHQSTSSFLHSSSCGKRMERLAVIAMPRFSGDDLREGPKKASEASCIIFHHISSHFSLDFVLVSSYFHDFTPLFQPI